MSIDRNKDRNRKIDIDRLATELRKDEGSIPYAYQDSLGYWTIGVGHLIDSRKGGGLSPMIIDSLLHEDIRKAIWSLDAYLPWWKTLDSRRKEVLANMCFNLGIGGLKSFRKMLAALKAKDYITASEEMLDSKWATQVGARATRLADIMRTEETGEEIDDRDKLP